MSAAVLARAALPADLVLRINSLTDALEDNCTRISALWNKPTFSEADEDVECALLDEHTELEEELLGLLLAAGFQPEKLRKALS